MPGSFNLNLPDPVRDVRAGLDLAWDWDEQNAARAAREDAWEQQRLARENNARAAGQFAGLSQDMRGTYGRTPPTTRSNWTPPTPAPAPTTGGPATTGAQGPTNAPTGNRDLGNGVTAASLTRSEMQSIFAAPGGGINNQGLAFRELTEQEIASNPELRSVLERGQRYGQLQIDVTENGRYRIRRRTGDSTVAGLSPDQQRGRMRPRLSFLPGSNVTFEENPDYRRLIERRQNASRTTETELPGGQPPTATPTSATGQVRRADQIDWTATGIPGFRLTQDIRPEGERPQGGAENSQHYLAHGGTAVDFNIDLPGGGILTQDTPEIRQRVAALAGVPVEQLRGGFTRRGTGAHFHYEWGSGGGQGAGAVADTGDAAEPVALAFAAFSQDPARLGVARQRADIYFDRYMEIAESYFNGGDIERGQAAMQLAMQAAEAGEVADNYAAVMSVTMGGNTDRFRELIAPYLGRDANDIDVVADQASGQIVLVERQGDQWRELNRFTPEELRHFGMYAVDAAYRDRADENAADLQEAMIAYERALGVASVTGQYGVAQAMIQQQGQNQRAEYEAATADQDIDVSEVGDTTYVEMNGELYEYVDRPRIGGRSGETVRGLQRVQPPGVIPGLRGGP